MRGRTKAFLPILVLLAAVIFPGCGKQPPKKASRTPDVTVVQPVRQEVTRYLEYTGTTAPLQSVDIRARVPGFLQQILFEPRARVKTGDLLFIIDPRQYEATVKEAKAQLEARKAHSKLAQTEVQISEQLESKEAISALRLEKKGAERDVAVADVELAAAALEKANLDLEWTRVTSPIDGRVSRNLVDAGNLVGAMEKTLLTNVVNDDWIYAYFYVSEQDLLPLSRKFQEKARETGKQLGKFPIQLGLADETGYPHEGHLDFAETKLDPTTGTIQVRGIFDNSNGLLMGGMFVRVRVAIEKKMALLVPEVALQVDQGGSFVLTVAKNNTVEQRRVKRGMVTEGMVAIDEGLKGDETVIVGGLQRARPGAPVNAVKGAVNSGQPGPVPQTKSEKN